MSAAHPDSSSSSAAYPWKEIPGSSHQILSERIAACGSGLAVLDLGSGSGFLARRIRPHCRYLAGIELDPTAAAAGASFFDELITGDLLSGLRHPFRERFDVVVAGDILEHLVDPETALRLVASLMAPSGLLLVSLPNVANVTIRLSLLLGFFSYRERGILDRTHLRFYTRKSGRDLLAKNGFRVVRIHPTAMPIELALPAIGRSPLSFLVRIPALLLARLWPSLFGYQFVYEAMLP